ncbi:glycosyltransferase family 2 protein [Candidatus Altiarchaeota archaeon]
MSKVGPLVSVVTPCFNNIQFIGDCIESVLAQDYPNVEHIIQDGKSTDGTIDILKRYNGKVDWISEPDNGQSDGLDRALKRCRGDFILVLNADDMLMPHACSWGVEQMEKTPSVAIVYGDEYMMDDNGEIIGKFYAPRPYDFKKVLCIEQVPPAQASFIRRKFFEDVGLYADTSLATCPDYEMLIRIGLKYPMIHVPGFVSKYRCHPGSEGQQSSMVPSFIKAKHTVQKRVFENPDTPTEIKSLRRRAYAGLLYWAASLYYGQRKIIRAIPYILKGFIVYPHYTKFHGDIIKYVSYGVLNNLRRRERLRRSVASLRRIEVIDRMFGLIPGLKGGWEVDNWHKLFALLQENATLTEETPIKRVWKRFPETNQKRIITWPKGEESWETLTSLTLEGLNRALNDRTLYDPVVFTEETLSPEAKILMAAGIEKLSSYDLRAFNYTLIEGAFPGVFRE